MTFNAGESDHLRVQQKPIVLESPSVPMPIGTGCSLHKGLGVIKTTYGVYRHTLNLWYFLSRAQGPGQDQWHKVITTKAEMTASAGAGNQTQISRSQASALSLPLDHS